MCTVSAIKAYLLRGELPENGIVCPVDERLFPPPTGEIRTSRPEWLTDGQFSAEDLRVLDAWKDLGQHMEPFVGRFGMF